MLIYCTVSAFAPVFLEPENPVLGQLSKSDYFWCETRFHYIVFLLEFNVLLHENFYNAEQFS